MGSVVAGITKRFEIPHSVAALTTFFVVLVASVSIALVTDKLWLLGAPMVVLVGYLLLVNYKAIYYLMWITIPVSTEVSMGSFSTDLPDEPLMIVCAGLCTVLLASKWRQLSFRALYHPVTLFLLLHMVWLALSSLTSITPIISWKVVAAKLWYVAAFYILTLLLIDPQKDVHKLFRWITVIALGTILVVWIRHAGYGFSFMSVNEVLSPFYRNHVSYALMLGTIAPYVWVFRKTWRGKYTGLIISVVFLVAIYFAYTRAAYIGLLIAAAAIAVMHFKLFRYVFITSVVAGAIAVYVLAQDYKYLDYAPNYERTITHYEFDELITATYEMEDISSMERIYRWIAGFYMYSDRPLMGFGPGAFYSAYKSYTDEHFRTYVSDNPEHSGIHNYYLMVLVEQGLPGLIIFVLLCFMALAKAEWLYHRLRPGRSREVIIAATASLVFICTTCLLNDMIETDKIGSFFFFGLAMIVALDKYALKSSD